MSTLMTDDTEASQVPFLVNTATRLESDVVLMSWIIGAAATAPWVPLVDCISNLLPDHAVLP